MLCMVRISATTTFNNLKHALMQTPVLTLPDFSKDFVIQTDASGSGIGAILLQDGHPISYFSKQMSLRLQQASTYVWEMFAITEAVKRWRQCLLGRPFPTIQTDHQSLRSIVNQTIQTPEQYKWLSKLLGYDFTITYRPGSDNGPADALSCVSQGSLNTLQAVSTPVCNVLTALREFLAHHIESLALIQSVADRPADYPHH
ncbi:reverse transcriptase [Tanacetum coccineum]|uniref:Reverse transcriptase n=1 Tax=Tanacetum coccineum TaxID=301880 RepID=A0ABQ5BQV8_9ASTR